MSNQSELTNQPVIILREGTSRSKGRDAQYANMMAAKIVSETVRSSLGPKGMDKMLVDGFGDVTITNDGATILQEMDIQHPAAKMMVEVAKTQDKEVGDGTTSVVVLAGELLSQAQILIDKEVHPTLIIDGYSKAAEKALEIYEELGMDIKPLDKAFLQQIAETSIAGKIVSNEKTYLAKIAVDAIVQVAEKTKDKYKVDIDDVKVQKKTGQSITETKLVQGIIIDKEVVHPEMPKRVENAKIALLECPIEIEKTEFSAKINIEKPEEMKAFLDEETDMLKGMVNKIVNAGANVVLCQKGIDDIAQHFLARKGIMGIRRVKSSDMEKLSKATGGKVVNNISILEKSDLGEAKLAEERKVGEDKWVFVEGCKSPRAMTILARGGSDRIVDEVERSFRDALMVVKDVVQDPKIVAGGGAPEIEVATKLRKFAQSLSGREQLAVNAFAEAMEAIPSILAENAGLDPIDVLVELRAIHEKGNKWFGVNVLEGKVDDMAKLNVYEPLVVKKQIIKSASEAATMILKIDDVIASSSAREARPPSGPSE